MAASVFEDIGVKFVSSGNHDLVWIGQASFLNKKEPLEVSATNGYNFCKQFSEPIMMFDGQDSHTLIGTSEVVSKLIDDGTPPAALLKNTLLSKEMYTNGYLTGRLYWGTGDYKPDPRVVDMVQLSGTNWLNTITPNFSHRNSILKSADVSAMFSYGDLSGYEHGVQHSKIYSDFRVKCISELNKLSGIKINMLSPGQRLSEGEYFNKMAECKIIVAPFGYGEIAPRDLQSAMMNSVLLKPNMNHLHSEPWIYFDGLTYLSCKHDYSDIGEVIDYIMSDYSNIRDFTIENMIKYFNEKYTQEAIVTHMHGVLSKLDIISHG
jgi:hypothetical protein